MAGERQMVMGVNDGGERCAIVLFREVPVMGPGELGVGYALAGIRHALESEISPVSEHRSEHRVGVVMSLAGAQVAER